ncbi:MAG: anhydro-N-acetylmuramic acid kinase, partial [Candidatus Riflebacteria bacterium]|nr:anhydro-N-acetylmuramic acid kinase [Candidatus Riflebacteria bacterium]
HPPELRSLLLALGEDEPSSGRSRSRAARADGLLGRIDRVELLARVNVALGEALALAVRRVARQARIPLAAVDLVGSHGQTVRHNPGAPPIGSLSARCTLQIGEAAILAQRTGAPVISDFRPADVAAGGLGAPLVPHVDRLLFSRPGQIRALQNFGGIGNVTYLPDPRRHRRLIAFDTGPGNMIMDAITRRVTWGRQTYDRDGVRASRGRPDPRILKRLMADRFLARPPPRTLGREQYGQRFVDRLWQLFESGGVGLDDRVATACAFTVAATADSYRRFLFPHGVPDEVIVSGGGALNPAVMRGLAGALAPVPVVTSAAHGVPVQAKEALAFAVLAYEWVRGRPANCPEATGARRGVVLGKATV